MGMVRGSKKGLPDILTRKDKMRHEEFMFCTKGCVAPIKWQDNNRRADLASDHHLVVAQLRFKLAANKSLGQGVEWKKFNIEKFNHGETWKKSEEELQKSLDQERMNELNPSETWTAIKEAMLAKSESILGLSHRKHSKDWTTEETWNRIKVRKVTKQKINNADDKTIPTLLAEYSEINKCIQSYARRNKQAWADKLAHNAQLAAETTRESYTKLQSGQQGSLLHATK